ncbi:hypothetical protein OTU49_012138, partial [Cherax quadricarinatus]
SMARLFIRYLALLSLDLLYVVSSLSTGLPLGGQQVLENAQGGTAVNIPVRVRLKKEDFDSSWVVFEVLDSDNNPRGCVKFTSKKDTGKLQVTATLNCSVNRLSEVTLDYLQHDSIDVVIHHDIDELQFTFNNEELITLPLVENIAKRVRVEGVKNYSYSPQVSQTPETPVLPKKKPVEKTPLTTVTVTTVKSEVKKKNNTSDQLGSCEKPVLLKLDVTLIAAAILLSIVLLILTSTTL